MKLMHKKGRGQLFHVKIYYQLNIPFFFKSRNIGDFKWVTWTLLVSVRACLFDVYLLVPFHSMTKYLLT